MRPDDPTDLSMSAMVARATAAIAAMFSLRIMAQWLPYAAASMTGVAGATMYFSDDFAKVIVSCVTAAVLWLWSESVRSRMELVTVTEAGVVSAGTLAALRAAYEAGRADGLTHKAEQV